MLAFAAVLAWAALAEPSRSHGPASHFHAEHEHPRQHPGHNITHPAHNITHPAYNMTHTHADPRQNHSRPLHHPPPPTRNHTHSPYLNVTMKPVHAAPSFANDSTYQHQARYIEMLVQKHFRNHAAPSAPVRVLACGVQSAYTH